jgi:dTDP-4-dehydrorhamnose 3,5-epimerase-like enzyme
MSHQLFAPEYERKDERGLFQEVLTKGQWESLIRGSMRKGAVIGNHYHKITTIFLFLAAGSVNIRTVNVETGERDQFLLEGGRGTYLVPNESHAIEFLEDSEIIMLKTHRYDPESPDTFEYPV